MGQILSSLNINSVITYITALAKILGCKLLSPIIAHILIYIFHKILKVDNKISKSGFYEPLKFILTVFGFGLAIYYLKLPRGVINLYNEIFKIFFVVHQLLFHSFYCLLN